MKIERNYFFHTVVCKTKSYDEVWEEVKEKSISQVIENIYNYCDFNFNNYISRKRNQEEKPKNLEEFKNLFQSLIDSSGKKCSSKYDGPGITIDYSYFYCPKCNTWHRNYEFLEPKTSFDNIIKKYREIITLDIILNIFSDFCYRYISKTDIYGEIFRLLYDKDIAKEVETEDKDNPDMIYHNTNPPFKLKGNSLKYYENKYIPYNEFVTGNNGMPILKCPSCGCKIEIEKNYNLNKIQPLYYSFRYLTRNYDWKEVNKYPTNYEIFNDGDSPKVVLSIIYSHFFPNVYGKMRVEKSNSRIVFNTKTGLSYNLRQIDMKTKKPLYDDVRIKNITYSNYFTINNVPPEVMQDTINAICKRQNIDTIYAEPLLESTTNNLSILTAVNRYSKLGKDFLLNYLKTNSFTNLNNKEKKELFDMQKDTNIFLKMLKRTKVSSKYLKRMFANNPMLIIYYKVLNNIGFKNIDVIINLLQSNQIIPLYKKLNVKTSGDYDNLKTFVTDYSSIKSETELSKKIMGINDDISIFVDIGNLYASCNKIIELLSKDQKKKIFKGSLQEIHDFFSQLVNTISSQDYYIPYTAEELKYNCICGDYIFTLAKTTSELKTVGQNMHICVGGYGKRACSKYCVILLMRNRKTNEMAACIELSPDYKEMIQTKDYCNQVISAEKVTSIVSYFNNYKIDCISSYDGEKNHFEKIRGNEEIIPLLDTNGYMIFNSKEDFENILLEKTLTINNEVIKLPENFVLETDNNFMDMPFL